MEAAIIYFCLAFGWWIESLGSRPHQLITPRLAELSLEHHLNPVNDDYSSGIPLRILDRTVLAAGNSPPPASPLVTFPVVVAASSSCNAPVPFLFGCLSRCGDGSLSLGTSPWSLLVVSLLFFGFFALLLLAWLGLATLVAKLTIPGGLFGDPHEHKDEMTGLESLRLSADRTIKYLEARVRTLLDQCNALRRKLQATVDAQILLRREGNARVSEMQRKAEAAAKAREIEFQALLDEKNALAAKLRSSEISSAAPAQDTEQRVAETQQTTDDTVNRLRSEITTLTAEKAALANELEGEMVIHDELLSGAYKRVRTTQQSAINVVKQAQSEVRGLQAERVALCSELDALQKEMNAERAAHSKLQQDTKQRAAEAQQKAVAAAEADRRLIKTLGKQRAALAKELAAEKAALTKELEEEKASVVTKVAEAESQACDDWCDQVTEHVNENTALQKQLDAALSKLHKATALAAARAGQTRLARSSEGAETVQAGVVTAAARADQPSLCESAPVASETGPSDAPQAKADNEASEPAVEEQAAPNAEMTVEEADEQTAGADTHKEGAQEQADDAETNEERAEEQADDAETNEEEAEEQSVTSGGSGSKAKCNARRKRNRNKAKAFKKAEMQGGQQPPGGQPGPSAGPAN